MLNCEHIPEKCVNQLGMRYFYKSQESPHSTVWKSIYCPEATDMVDIIFHGPRGAVPIKAISRDFCKFDMVRWVSLWIVCSGLYLVWGQGLFFFFILFILNKKCILRWFFFPCRPMKLDLFWNKSEFRTDFKKWDRWTNKKKWLKFFKILFLKEKFQNKDFFLNSLLKLALTLYIFYYTNFLFLFRFYNVDYIFTTLIPRS